MIFFTTLSWGVYSCFKTPLKMHQPSAMVLHISVLLKSAPSRSVCIEELFLFQVSPLTCCFNFSSRQVGCHLVDSWQPPVVLAKILAVDFFFNEGNQCFDKI
jgi:hypothetical protein